MSDLLEKTLAWKMVWSKGIMLTFINMGTVLIAAMQGWNRDYVDSMGWWSWTVLIASIIVSGFNTISAYMDKTFSIEGDKVTLANVKIEAQNLAQAKVDAKIEATKDSNETNPTNIIT